MTHRVPLSISLHSPAPRAQAINYSVAASALATVDGFLVGASGSVAFADKVRRERGGETGLLLGASGSVAFADKVRRERGAETGGLGSVAFADKVGRERGAETGGLRVRGLRRRGEAGKGRGDGEIKIQTRTHTRNAPPCPPAQLSFPSYDVLVGYKVRPSA